MHLDGAETNEKREKRQPGFTVDDELVGEGERGGIYIGIFG